MFCYQINTSIILLRKKKYENVVKYKLKPGVLFNLLLYLSTYVFEELCIYNEVKESKVKNWW